MPITRSADAMMLTASPKASPGVRLKEIVTEGTCCWCSFASGAVMRVVWAKAESWTLVLHPPGTKLESVRIFCDIDEDAQAPLLRLGRHITEDGILPQRVDQPVGPGRDFGRVGCDQRVLVLCAAGSCGNLDVLHRLEIDRHAGNVGNGAPQAVDD